MNIREGCSSSNGLAVVQHGSATLENVTVCEESSSGGSSLSAEPRAVSKPSIRPRGMVLRCHPGQISPPAKAVVATRHWQVRGILKPAGLCWDSLVWGLFGLDYGIFLAENRCLVSLGSGQFPP